MGTYFVGTGIFAKSAVMAFEILTRNGFETAVVDFSASLSDFIIRLYTGRIFCASSILRENFMRSKGVMAQNPVYNAKQIVYLENVEEIFKELL